MIWIVIALCVIVLGWYGFEGWWDRRLFSSAPGCQCVNVHPKQVMAFLKAHSETQVLDVRSDAEFSAGALPNAIHIPFPATAFDERVSRLDPTKPVLVYCAGGYRSRKAVARLKALGFANIQHLHRGYLSWKQDTRS